MTLLHPTDAARSFPSFAPLGEAQSGQALRQRTARPLSEERLTDMSKRTDRLGYVAPQATEFGHRLAAWKSAVAASDALKAPADESGEGRDAYEAALDRVVPAEDAAADALVATPAETIEQVALKVDAIYRRWVGGASLAELETRRWIAALPADKQQTTTDKAQCLLALYLDLTGLPAPELPKRPPARVAESAFSTLFAAYEAAEAEENEALRLERETGQALDDELDRLQGARISALWSLMLEPAPDLDSLAWKLARSIDIAHADYVGDSADNPETISRLLSGRAWDDGCIPAVAYQDVLRLAGHHGPITEAKPDDFDPKVFLADLEDRTGAGITLTETGSPAIAATDMNGASGNPLAAAQSWAALSPARRGQVQDHLMGVSR